LRKKEEKKRRRGQSKRDERKKKEEEDEKKRKEENKEEDSLRRKRRSTTEIKKDNCFNPNDLSDVYDFLFPDNSKSSSKKKILLSKSYSSFFICRVIRLMFDAINIKEILFNSLTKYYIKITLKNPSSLTACESILENSNNSNFFGILENVENIVNTPLL
jgi:hypothetical protein